MTSGLDWLTDPDYAKKREASVSKIPGLQQAAEAAATTQELVPSNMGFDSETGQYINYGSWDWIDVKDPAVESAYIDKALQDPTKWVASNLNWSGLGDGGNFYALDDQIKYLKDNKYDLNTLDKRGLTHYNLTKQIIGQGTTGRWSGAGFGGPVENAKHMASTLMTAGIEDIKDFGQFKKKTLLNNMPVQQEMRYDSSTDLYIPTGKYYYSDEYTDKSYIDPKYVRQTPAYDTDGNYAGIAYIADNVPVGTQDVFGNKKTQQPITQDYNQAYGNIFSGTYAGHGRTNFGVQFAADGTPYFYTQFGGDTSDMSDIAPILTVLSIIPSPLQPFAAAANALIAIDNGNTLGGLAALAGIPGVSEAASAAGLANVVTGIQTANQVVNLVNAVESGNVAAVVGTAAGALGAGSTPIGDTGLTVSDAMKAANLVQAISSENPEAIFKAAVGFANSKTIQNTLSNPSTTLNADGQKVADVVDPSFVADLVNPDSPNYLGQAEEELGTTILAAQKEPPSQIYNGFDFGSFQIDPNFGSNLLRPDGTTLVDNGFMGPVGPVTVPGIDKVADLVTGGGDTVAGPAGITSNYVQAMPQMQPRAGEFAGDVVEDEDGVFRRTITRKLADGTESSYNIVYDPEDSNRPISYEVGSPEDRFTQILSDRPSLEEETGVSTDTSLSEEGAKTDKEEKGTITGGEDIIFGGKDTITGGEDTVIVGQDTVTGGEDTITGGEDTITGGEDTITGGEDTVTGGTDTEETTTEEEKTTEEETPDCGEGYHWDEAAQICVPDSDEEKVQECPEGYVFNATTGVCELISEEETHQCADGFHWDESRQLCVPDDETDCGPGFHWDEEKQLCIADDDTEEKEEECPEGYIRNLDTDVCEPVSTSTSTSTSTTSTTSTDSSGRRTATRINALAPMAAEAIKTAPLSDFDVLKTTPPPYQKMAEFQGPLDEFLKMVEKNSYVPRPEQPKPQQMQPQQMQPDRLDQPTGDMNMADYFNYGQQTSIDDVLAPPQPGFKDGGMASPLMAASGGPLSVVNHSGKERLDFRKGAAVSGPGDGQSDDIPAMLADGEFVFPADVVAALGNGSTKAGSDKLYEMMHSIRAYHRSAKPQDLPPPAKKSPLDYLKKASKARR